MTSEHISNVLPACSPLEGRLCRLLMILLRASQCFHLKGTMDTCLTHSASDGVSVPPGVLPNIQSISTYHLYCLSLEYSLEAVPCYHRCIASSCASFCCSPAAHTRPSVLIIKMCVRLQSGSTLTVTRLHPGSQAAEIVSRDAGETASSRPLDLARGQAGSVFPSQTLPAKGDGPLG